MISAAWLVSCVLLAQPEQSASPSVELPATVKRLARQLDDSQLAKRDAAEKELIALGPDALNFLPQITAKTPAEVKDRLGRVRKTLEAAAVEAATKPSLVTLQGEMSLADALASLQKQSGNKLHDIRRKFGDQTRAVTVKLDCEKTTFWQALDQVLDQAGMTVYSYGGEEGTVAIVNRSEGEVDRANRAAYSGMFRFEGMRLEATRDIRNPMNHSLRFTMDVSWEPRLRPIIVQQPLDQVKAIDESGQPLEIDGREGEVEVDITPDSFSSEIYIPLMLPNRNVKKIASLKGTMNVIAPGRVETFEFVDLEKAKEVEQKRAGVSVTLEKARRSGEIYEVRVIIKFDQATVALESHQDWISSNPAYLIDPDGKAIENAGLEETLRTDDAVGYSYKFVRDDGLAGHKFVYKTPAAIVKLPVEYELKDIELP